MIFGRRRDAPDEVPGFVEFVGLTELEQSLQGADVRQKDDDGSRILIGEEAVFGTEIDDTVCIDAAEQFWKRGLNCGFVEICLEVIDGLMAEAVRFHGVLLQRRYAGDGCQICG